jgi:hypothetical protein
VVELILVTWKKEYLSASAKLAQDDSIFIAIDMVATAIIIKYTRNSSLLNAFLKFLISTK